MLEKERRRLMAGEWGHDVHFRINSVHVCVCACIYVYMCVCY